ncbi:AraC family transcriptional regulator [Aurantimonas sp. VKM B-3413]|uniref:helix-turn-helix domain-containing protein n=1 Tax=Aurantimonas sp. VKM B-3413 TaxID=2779401 RepID=UPI001E5D2128|nr:AraC family transcriptional regulator [Aurantimonas sp. VKM B-3413]MCB8838286.1 AraC family transcriptional regulator [Aurantimonas sp. VKM B-3413]
MLALPISIVVSLVLAYLLTRLLAGRRIAAPLALLLFACIVQGVVNALAQHYGVAAFRLVQPVTAMMIPPLAWLALRHAQGHGRPGAEALLHLLAPAFVGFCVWTARAAVDAAVVTIFAGYGAAMLLALRAGADALPEARLDAGDWPPLVWRAIGAMLIASALSDMAISLAVGLGAGWLKSWIVSLGTSATLLLIGILAASNSLRRQGAGADVAGPAMEVDADLGEEVRDDAAERQRDAAIMAELSALLGEQKLHRDSQLTLSRLARRLGLPAKRVSEAINRQTGENVSRYVNGYRVREACALIAAGRSVTDAMLDSGFATKSNFNREFRRVTGHAPTEWMSARAVSVGDAGGPPRQLSATASGE